MKKPEKIIWLFFLLMFFGLFLGDGKQGVVEIYGAIVTLVLWGVMIFRGGPVRAFPRDLLFPWAIVCFACIISSARSDSLGFSLSWFVRLASGYLICALFYNVHNKQGVQKFIISSLWYVCLGSLAAVAVRALPQLWALLPSMNLLRLVYGHNHLADILVFAAPLVLYVFGNNQLPRFVRKIAIPIYSIVLLATLARAAWIIVGGYFFYEFFISLKKRREQKATRTLMVIGAVFVLATTVVIAQGEIVGKTAVFSGKSQSAMMRMEYWRQAAVSFSERPALGSGPGTFSLASIRLQRAPGSYSSFAHSLPLQIMAETGLVGFIVCVWLIVAVLRRARQGKKNIAGPDRAAYHFLYCSVLLLLVYSLVEFTLDYFVVWLLFWASVGALMGAGGRQSELLQAPKSVFIAGPLCFLGVFYLLWVSSAFSVLVENRHGTAFYLAPFDATNTLAYLTSAPRKDLSPTDINTAVFFHRNNPEILKAIGRNLQAQNGADKSLVFYERATRLDPYNGDSQKALLSLLASRRKHGQYLDEIIRLCGKYGKSARGACHIYFSAADRELVAKTMVSHHEKIMETTEPSIGLQKALYFTGLDLAQVRPDTTRLLWSAAISLEPNWGYFPVELASLEYRALYNSQAARSTLQQCRANIYTATWCASLLGDLETLPVVGTHAKNILAMPRILNE